MPLWVHIIVIAVAGVFGGLTNAFMVNRRSSLPEEMAQEAGVSPTTTPKLANFYVSNGFLGAAAACVSWAAYGPNNAANILEGNYPLTAATLATAFVIGMGGTKWLQSERDKGRWQATASAAALAEPNPQLQRYLSMASSDQAPQIATKLANIPATGSNMGAPAEARRGRGGDSAQPGGAQGAQKV
jgi:hypothetical protein